MTDEYIGFSAQTLPESEWLTKEQAWEVIKEASRLLIEPGYMQKALKDDPLVGPEFKATLNRLLHIVVDGFDAGEALEEHDPNTEEMAHLLNEIQRIQVQFGVAQISKVSIAIQQLPISEIVTSFETEDDKFGKSDVDPNAIDEMRARLNEADKNEDPENKHGLAVVTVDPRIKDLMAAGIMAAGGPTEFAKLQVEIVEAMPQELRANPTICFATQMVGAICKAWIKRAAAKEMVQVSTRSMIEMVIAAKQAAQVPYVAAYGVPNRDLVNILAESFKAQVNQCLDDINGEVTEEAPAKTEVMAESKHFSDAKPTSTNVEGNRTLN